MHEPLAQALRDWQPFYLLTGGAAATLAGLLFLAVQFGAGLRYPAGVPSAIQTFVLPTFVRFVCVLLITALINSWQVMTWIALQRGVDEPEEPPAQAPSGLMSSHDTTAGNREARPEQRP